MTEKQPHEVMCKNDGVKSYGGIIPHEALSRDMARFISQVNSHLKEEWSKQSKPQRRVHFNIFESKRINAFAFKSDEHNIDFIGITHGIYHCADAVSCAALSLPSFMSHIGSPATIERPNVDSFRVYLSNIQNEPLDKELPIIPQDAIRMSYAGMLALNIIMEVLHHECGHIIFGHLEYLYNYKSCISEICEADDCSNGNIKDMPIEELWALEFHADVYATNTMIMNSQDLVRDQPNQLVRLIHSEPEYESLVFLHLIAKNIVFRLLDIFGDQDKPIEKRTHPPALLRSLMIDEFLCDIHKEDIPRIRNLADKARKQVDTFWKWVGIEETPQIRSLARNMKTVMQHNLNALQRKLKPR